MQSNQNSSQYSILKHRFESLMISTAKANALVGKESPGVIRYEESEQGSARRKLLNVEKQAIEDRKLQEINNESYVDTVRNEFHQILLTHFDKEICDTPSQFHNVLGLTNTMPELLDMLAIRASSIARIEPLAARIPWIYDELMKVVNAPQHRRKDSRGKVIVVETLRTALSFINIDNLKMLVPALAFRRTIPQVTDPFPQIKSRAWQYNLGVALTARQLAPLVGVKENDAYVLGLLQGLGCNAITRLYFRLFERVQREELEKAQRAQQRDRHDALTQITPSCNFLLALWSDFGDEITANFVHFMQLKRVFIEAASHELAENTDTDNALATLIKQSRIYSQFRMLSAHRMLEKEEAKVMLRESRIPISEIERLKKINITTLPLVMKPEMDITE